MRSGFRSDVERDARHAEIERSKKSKARRSATAALLLTVTAIAAQGQDSPLTRARERAGHTRDVVVAERYKFFPGGRALPVAGDEARVIARLESPWATPGDLGLALMPGLTIGSGHTVRMSGLRDAGRPARLVTLRPVAFRGVPLAPGSDVLSVADADGKVLVARERNLPRTVDGTVPTVPEDAARTAALVAAREHEMPADAVAGMPALEVFVAPHARGRLAWRIRVASPSRTAPWARDLWIAAIGQPEVLADREGIHHMHNGRATANAWTDTPFGQSPAQDLAGAIVMRNNPVDTAVTGPDGRYAYTSGGGTAWLGVGVVGTQSFVHNDAGVSVFVSASGTPASPVDLFINATGDAELAQTTAFVWVNHAHAFTEDFLSGSALASLDTNVNVTGSCNAFWDGSSLNFFQAGGGCPNTAYSDVVLHEYGHAVDEAQAGRLDDGYSEGFGDALVILRTRQSCVGRDLLGLGTCARRATDVVLWPPNPGEDVHAIGHRYTGFVQALIDELSFVFGPDEAYETARQLVLGAGAANPASVPDAVRLSFVVDDDDGNLENGTPHCAQLAAAANSRRIPHPRCPSFEHVRTMADLNRDGRADIVGFGDKGVWTALARGDGSFTEARFVLANFGAYQGWSPARHVRVMADIDDDGQADIVAFGDAGVWTALSAGDGTFAPPRFVMANFGSDQAWDAARHVRIMADINRDGRADIVAFGDDGVWTALSAGDGSFAAEHYVLRNFGTEQAWDSARHVRTLADLNDDGRADIVAFGDDGVWTALSAGDGSFAAEGFVLANFGTNQAWDSARHVRTLADLNNDGRADIVAFGNDGVWTALSTGEGAFAPEHFVLRNFGTEQAWDAARHIRTVADINADGNADIVAFGNDGVWTALSAGDGSFAPEGFVLAEFGADQRWDPSRHVRLMADLSADGARDIVAFGDAGVWTALAAGGGVFAPHHFVLANFGNDQGWKGGAR